jgi:septal ring factor EnvC (AmiA/AmiB activator)
MSEFKPITTQEEFDKAIQERLNRQKETIEKQYADYAEIKARNQELETEVGTLKAALAKSNEKAGKYDKDISELNAKIAGYETANMRTKIALQHGIPYELASRLVGEDEESITADAKKLAELIGSKEPIPPLKDVEPKIDDKDSAYKSLLENLNLEGE